MGCNIGIGLLVVVWAIAVVGASAGWHGFMLTALLATSALL
jgi:hypothetical protein